MPSGPFTDVAGSDQHTALYRSRTGQQIAGETGITDDDILVLYSSPDPGHQFIRRGFITYHRRRNAVDSLCRRPGFESVRWTKQSIQEGARQYH